MNIKRRLEDTCKQEAFGKCLMKQAEGKIAYCILALEDGDQEIIFNGGDAYEKLSVGSVIKIDQTGKFQYQSGEEWLEI